MKSKKILPIGIAFALLVILGVTTLLLLRKPAQESVSLEETKEELTSHEITLEDLTRQSEGFDNAEEELKQFEEANPLVRYLPYRSESFEIYYRVNGPTGMEATYVVILNLETSPAETAEYNDEVNRLTELAFKWFRSKGVNPDALPIEWGSASDFL